MSSQNEKLQPQTKLAEEIINELVGKNLISETRRKHLQQKIVAGNLKPEDWSLLVDIAAEQNNHQIKK